MSYQLNTFGPSTTSTAWGGWSTLHPRCFGCKYSAMSRGTLVCYCMSRTIRRAPEGNVCESYRENEVS